MEHAVGAASRRLPPSCLLVATRRSHPGSSTCIDENKRQHEVRGEHASPLQVLTSEAWYLPAVEFLVGPGVAEHAICSSGFSRSSWAVVAPSCVASDRVPRFRAAFGRRTPAALLATEPLASARSRHVRDARGHRAASQGGPGTQLQDPGACFQQQTTTRRGSGPWSRWQPQYIVTCQYCEYV